MTPLPRRALAEVIGTFFLCFVGVSALCTNTLKGADGSGLLGVALAHGLALSVAIGALGKVSGGHFNPAVTLTMVATRQMPPKAGFVYVASQLAGGTLAGFAAKLAYSQGTYVAAGGGVPAPAEDVGFGLAVLLEAIATFFLLIAVFGTAVDAKAPSLGGFGIGLTVTFNILAIGPLTGASMNPARTFGPAVAYSLTPGVGAAAWASHLVYWIGPVLGGIVAGVLYCGFFLSPAPSEKPPGSGID
jgi:MIP family channel proteins